MTVDVLTGRYRRLLACYPRWYREERGGELVGTLLDGARPGQTWPTWREARPLVLEGLRVRAGTSGHRSVRTTLADGLRVTVLLALVMWMLGVQTELVNSGLSSGEGLLFGVFDAAIVALGMVPFGLVARGRFGPALWLVALGVPVGLGLAPMLRSAGGGSSSPLDGGLVAFSLVALAGAAVLRRHPASRSRAGTVMLVCAVAPPVLLVVPAYLPVRGPADSADILWYGQVAPFALGYLVALAYTTIDPRPALALAAFLVLVSLQVVSIGVSVGVSPGSVADVLTVTLAGAAIAAAAAGLGVRRQVAALPTKVGG